jgi:hypothetical protein
VSRYGATALVKKTCLGAARAASKLKTAKTLGLTMPPGVLTIADEMIE